MRENVTPNIWRNYRPEEEEDEEEKMYSTTSSSSCSSSSSSSSNSSNNNNNNNNNNNTITTEEARPISWSSITWNTYIKSSTSRDSNKSLEYRILLTRAWTSWTASVERRPWTSGPTRMAPSGCPSCSSASARPSAISARESDYRTD